MVGDKNQSIYIPGNAIITIPENLASFHSTQGDMPG